MTPKRVSAAQELARAAMKTFCDDTEVLAAALTLKTALKRAYGSVLTIGNFPVGEVKIFVDRRPVSIIRDRIVVTVKNENQGVGRNQLILEFGIGDEKQVPVFCKVKLKLINTRTGEITEGSFEPPEDYAGYKDLITATFNSLPSGSYEVDFLSEQRRQFHQLKSL